MSIVELHPKRRKTTPSQFLKLSFDCLQEVLSFCPCSTILSLRPTCKSLYKLLILSTPKNWAIRERKAKIKDDARKESEQLRKEWEVKSVLYRDDVHYSDPGNYHRGSNHSNSLLRSQLELMLTILPNDRCLRCAILDKVGTDSSDPRFLVEVHEAISRCKSCGFYYSCKYCDDDNKKWRFCEECEERFCPKCVVRASCGHDLCKICAYDEGKLVECENPKCTSKVSYCKTCWDHQLEKRGTNKINPYCDSCLKFLTKKKMRKM